MRSTISVKRLLAAGALALAMMALTPGSGSLAAEDPFVSGARLVRLIWAGSNCGGRPQAGYVAKLEAAEALDPDQFNAGRRAAERSIAQSVREGASKGVCDSVLRDFGPNGGQARGMFRKPAG